MMSLKGGEIFRKWILPLGAGMGAGHASRGGSQGSRKV